MKYPPVPVTIRGQTWTVLRDGRVGPKNDADCADSRAAEAKIIRIRKNLKPARVLELAIHEALHAAYPDIDEDAVTAGTAAVLELLGAVLPGLDKI